MDLWRVQTPAFLLWQMKEIATASGWVSQSHQSYKEAYSLDWRNLTFSIKLEWTFSRQLRGICLVCCLSSVSKTSKWTLKSYAKRHCIYCQLQNQVAGAQEKLLFITSGKIGTTHCVPIHVTQKGHTNQQKCPDISCPWFMNISWAWIPMTPWIWIKNWCCSPTTLTLTRHLKSIDSNHPYPLLNCGHEACLLSSGSDWEK